MTKRGKYNALFSNIDLFIIDKLLSKGSVCLRDLTTAKKTSNNGIFQKKINNLINLSLIKKEKPKGKKINYSIKNKEKLKHLNSLLKKVYNFYNLK